MVLLFLVVIFFFLGGGGILDLYSTYQSLHFSCSNISEMRQRHKDAFLKKHGVKLGFMSAFIKASAHALQSEPTVNAGQLHL